MGRVERWSARGLFVSSTFEDMHAERDFLQEVIFGELENLLRNARQWLAPVDLRWGIDTLSLAVTGSADGQEDLEHQKHLAVLTHCLYSVGMCQPFMIVFLGDRYGWVPPIEHVRQAAQVVGFRGDVADRSVTALEVEYGVLDSQAEMQRTHFFFRRLDDTAMASEDRRRYSDAQRAAAEADPSRRTEAQRSADLLESLKRRIAAKCPNRVHTYRARWEPAKGVTGFEDELRTLILDHVGKDLLAAATNVLLRQPRDWVEAEERALDEFIDFRLRVFLGREAVLTTLIDFCLSPSGDAGYGRCIVGEPGIGKSSLFSALLRELDRSFLGQIPKDRLRPEQRARLRTLQEHDAILLGHAAGMSGRSAGVRDLLVRWVRELALSLGEPDPAGDATSVDELRGLFNALLFRAAAHHRVILLLDALNLFERTDVARYLQWLPRVLPPNCRLVATANVGDESAEFGRRGWVVDPLAPLDGPAIEAIFRDVSEQLYYRQGEGFESVRTALTRKSDSAGRRAGGNALWLRLALDLLNQLGGETFARQQTSPYRDLSPEARLNLLLSSVVDEMPGDVDQLCGWLLERAETAAGHFGKSDDARLFTSLIAVSRSGLRERDLKALLLSLSGEQWSDLRLAVLRRTFRTHLVERGDLAQWDFFHAQMRSAVRQRYLAGPNEEARLHRSIALYLSGRLQGVKLLPADDLLAERELMHHWLSSGDEAEVARCCSALIPGTPQADAALSEFVQYGCRSSLDDNDAQAWLRRIAGQWTAQADAARCTALVAEHVIPRLKTFAGRQRRVRLAQVLWHWMEHAKSSLVAGELLLHAVSVQNELAHALREVGDLANAAWQFFAIIRMLDEAARNGEIPEPLLLTRCTACQAIAGILATPLVLGLRQDAWRYLDSACSVAERYFSGAGPLASRWALLYTSLLIARSSLVPKDHKQEYLRQARRAAQSIRFEPARNHALGVLALARSRYVLRTGAEAEAEARVSISTLKRVHAEFPSQIEPLQHLIEALTHLATLPEFSSQRFNDASADLEGLTSQLDRLSNGNKDLLPAPFRLVDPLFHMRYWASVTAQVKTLIDAKQFERAEFLMNLSWVALSNLARHGSWAPQGKHIEEYLADVASQSLAIAAFYHKSKPEPLRVGMTRLVDAVALSLARDRPVAPDLRQIYDALLKAQPALAGRATQAGASESAIPNASLVVEPELHLDGTGWSRHDNEPRL
jgi:hypothetical protein